jgi:hypothetical protein
MMDRIMDGKIMWGMACLGHGPAWAAGHHCPASLHPLPWANTYSLAAENKFYLPL